MRSIKIPHPEISKHAVLVRSHKFAHLVYYGAVAVEGHGVYAVAGGALLLFTCLAFFVDIGE